MLFKRYQTQNDSPTLLLTPLDMLKPVFVYLSFNSQIVNIVVKKQIHMYLSVINPKIKTFRNFRIFVLSPISKNENSEITEILQKCDNTEM